MFPRMLMKLVSLRTLSSVHSEQVFALRLQDKKLPPLLSEIWDVHEWAGALPPGQNEPVSGKYGWAGVLYRQRGHDVLKGWNHCHEKSAFIILFLDFYILDPVFSELLPLSVLLIDYMARSSSGTFRTDNGYLTMVIELGHRDGFGFRDWLARVSSHKQCGHDFFSHCCCLYLIFPVPKDLSRFCQWFLLSN